VKWLKFCVILCINCFTWVWLGLAVWLRVIWFMNSWVISQIHCDIQYISCCVVIGSVLAVMYQSVHNVTWQCLDLVWSDPEEVDTWAVSPRGAGWLFGNKVTNEVSQIYTQADFTFWCNFHWAKVRSKYILLPKGEVISRSKSLSPKVCSKHIHRPKFSWTLV